MSKDTTPPLPPPDSTEEGLLSALTPLILSVTTGLGQVFEVGKPYPELPRYPQVGGKITRILEIPGDDDVGSTFLVRIEEGALPPGYVGHERIPWASVEDVAEVWPDQLAADTEAEEAADPRAGINVQRLVQSWTTARVGRIWQIGHTMPQLPAPHDSIRGQVQSITREADGVYRVRIGATPSELTPAGTVLMVRVSNVFSALEFVDTSEADTIEHAAQLAAVDALDAAAHDDDDDDDDDDTPTSAEPPG